MLSIFVVEASHADLCIGHALPAAYVLRVMVAVDERGDALIAETVMAAAGLPEFLERGHLNLDRVCVRVVVGLDDLCNLEHDLPFVG